MTDEARISAAARAVATGLVAAVEGLKAIRPALEAQDWDEEEPVTVLQHVTEMIDLAESGADRIVAFFINSGTADEYARDELVDAACTLTRVAEMLKVIIQQGNP